MSSPRALDLPLTYTAVLRGQPVAYRLVVSPRARSWRLSIHPHTGLSVVVPAGARLDVNALLAGHVDWIRRSLARIARRPVPRTMPLTHGSLLPYLGNVLRLEMDDRRDGEPQYDQTLGTLSVGEVGLRGLLTRVEAWYRRQAEGVFAERLRVLNASVGFRFNRVTIRDQRTRWGSCSASGNLAFNWRLLLAPLAIVDSVVAHELTHLVERSHAPSFWRRLETIDPSYDAHRAWLGRYGAWLSLGCEPPPALG